MYYELAFVLNSLLKEKDQKSELKNIKETITANGGNVVQETPLDGRTLGYPMAKQRRGLLGVQVFTIKKSEKLPTISQRLNRSEHVLRYVITKHRTLPDPNAMRAALAAAQASQDRADKKRAAQALATGIPAQETKPAIAPKKRQPRTLKPAATAAKKKKVKNIDETIKDILSGKIAI